LHHQFTQRLDTNTENKFSILTEVEEENASLERVRELEDEREDDEDSEPSDEQDLEGIEQYSVTNWFTIENNHFRAR
jgi:hypothetical protein